MPPIPRTRLAASADAAAVGRLLHDFNTEYDEPTPGPAALAARLRLLLEGGDTAVLLAGERSGDVAGVAVLRFRPALWTEAVESHLAELYVVPERRGCGLGRALLIAAMDHARNLGADRMDLGTGETDEAARALYESLGFVNREDGPDGPRLLWYERAL